MLYSVPLLRDIGGDAPKRAAQRFGQVAWPFFGLAVVTGIWNLSEVGLTDRSNSYQVGVMLYQVLSGRLPFEGSLLEVLRLKQKSEAPPLKMESEQGGRVPTPVPKEMKRHRQPDPGIFVRRTS